MNLELSEEQRLLQSACASLLERHSGRERARELAESGECDRPLLDALDAAGMLDIALDPESGPLGAQLVTEWAAEAAAYAPVGWRALIAPQVIDGSIPPVIAVVHGPDSMSTRFAEGADLVLAVDGTRAVLASPGQWKVDRVGTKYGYPLGAVEILGGTELGEQAADLITRWSRVVLATEIAGAARSALKLTVQYVKDRYQFGRSLGSYQAIQHRLAEVHMLIEATSLLAKDAAFHDASAESAAVAATFAADCAHRILTDLHQFTGAIGFAKEYDLYLWTMKLEYLALEAGGLAAHTDALFASRWSLEAVGRS